MKNSKERLDMDFHVDDDSGCHCVDIWICRFESARVNHPIFGSVAV